ncbi:hypothetical protein MicroSTF_00145 [Microbacterium sp. STF-2]|uniref:hypothetical protein n=1 Tax=Microbacterium sp. STF-2 TaxID=3031132 RepID=UPI002AFEDB14|nr:hypothetical protein [Microbacterium sp. STF-2]MEA1261425.1 hypothetical protein [Microbacterium sp. STF-2]
MSEDEDEPSPWAEIVGPCYTVTRLARILGWTEAEVMATGKDLRLLALHSDDHVDLFPSFQLRDGKIVEGLRDVLRALETGTPSRWTWAQWLNVALPVADPPRNITLLYEGRLEEAVRDARHDAWSWSS